MSQRPECSIIVTNYNYARFLAACIDSALAQTGASIEVVVVDDGSTDQSSTVIAGYGSRIKALYKANGGQASAFNAGFAASTADVVIFLDADDLLAPQAVARALPAFEDDKVVKVHWPLRVIDQDGNSLGRTKPDDASRLPQGDLREAVIRDGPTNRVWPPTSGNAWSRRFLDDVLPMDEAAFGVGADNYLFELAPFHGLIRTVHKPLSSYRLHDRNSWATLPLVQKLHHQLRFIEQSFPVIARHCENHGRSVDLAKWRNNSWWCKLGRTLDQLDELIPRDQPFVLADDGAFGLEADPGSQAIPFPACDGHFWGSPGDDQSAIAELERRVDQGITVVVVAWPAFWYLEHFKGLGAYLDTHFRKAVDDELMVAFFRPML